MDRYLNSSIALAVGLFLVSCAGGQRTNVRREFDDGRQ